MSNIITTSDYGDWVNNPSQAGLKNNYSATTAPGVTNDVDEGYSVGSHWYDTTNDLAYVCLDITDGAAVWTEVTAGAAGGDAWGDPVNAVITPDVDGTRDLATTATRFGTAYVDNLDVTTNIVVGGTVDGRDVAADGTQLDTNTTKLAGIEASATADQSAAEIKTAYESNADTNAYTDADQTSVAALGTLSTESKLSVIGSPTYTTVQDIHNLYHSTGVIDTTASMSDGGSGTLDITAVHGCIRATDDQTAALLLFSIGATTGLALTDNDLNYIYVEYNAGTPQVVATISKRADTNTNVALGTVYREGTTLHITNGLMEIVGNHSGLTVRRLQEVESLQRASGAILGESGTRNITLTAGVYWSGLVRITSPAEDTSVSDTFSYYYQDGIGGWTEVATQTQISNTQYDDGSGTLAALSTNRYGVHWVYKGVDSNLYVLYGYGDYVLVQAQEAPSPATVPPHFEGHALLVGKIIIQKDAAAFISTETPFTTTFTTTSTADHGGLSGLGDDDHTQYLLADGTRTLSGSLTVTGTVDGRDVAADGTQLDTNTTKLAGIEALADVTDATNVAAAGAVMDGDYSTNGLNVRTSAGAYTNRSITGTASEITVTNGDGVSGNPTLSLPAAIDLGGKTSLEIPNGAAPTVSTAGQVAIDTSITSHNGYMKYHDGVKEMVIPAIPTADLTTTDNHIIKYNLAGTGFTMEADAGAGGGGFQAELNFKAAGMEVNTTTEEATIEYVDLGTIEGLVRAFDDTTSEYCQDVFNVPTDIDTAGNVTIEIYGKRATGTAAANIYWDFDHRPLVDSESWDGTYTTVSSGALAVNTVLANLDKLSITVAVSTLGWVGGDMVEFRLGRDAADAGDTLSGDFYVRNIRIIVDRA